MATYSRPHQDSAAGVSLVRPGDSTIAPGRRLQLHSTVPVVHPEAPTATYSHQHVQPVPHRGSAAGMGLVECRGSPDAHWRHPHSTQPSVYHGQGHHLNSSQPTVYPEARKVTYYGKGHPDGSASRSSGQPAVYPDPAMATYGCARVAPRQLQVEHVMQGLTLSDPAMAAPRTSMPHFPVGHGTQRLTLSDPASATYGSTSVPPRQLPVEDVMQGFTLSDPATVAPSPLPVRPEGRERGQALPVGFPMPVSKSDSADVKQDPFAAQALGPTTGHPSSQGPPNMPRLEKIRNPTAQSPKASEPTTNRPSSKRRTRRKHFSTHTHMRPHTKASSPHMSPHPRAFPPQVSTYPRAFSTHMSPQPMAFSPHMIPYPKAFSLHMSPHPKASMRRPAASMPDLELNRHLGVLYGAHMGYTVATREGSANGSAGEEVECSRKGYESGNGCAKGLGKGRECDQEHERQRECDWGHERRRQCEQGHERGEGCLRESERGGEGCADKYGSSKGLHEDLELRILRHRLTLLDSQRELAAVRCQRFIDILESSLEGGSAAHPPRLAAAAQSFPPPCELFSYKSSTLTGPSEE